MGIDFFWPDDEAMPPYQFPWVASELHRKVMWAAEGRDIHWALPAMPPRYALELHGLYCQTIRPLPLARYIADYDVIRGGWVHRLDVMVEFEEV